MKINAAPIEIYRQASALTSGKTTGPDQRDIGSAGQTRTEVITLPGTNTASPPAVTVTRGPSPFAGVLSAEEKTLLVKYFARFGDSAEAAPGYTLEAKPHQPVNTGRTLDIRG